MRLKIRIGTVAVIASAVAAAGCTLFSGPKSQLVSIAITSDTIVAGVDITPTTNWLQFTIPVSIHNGQSATLPVDICDASLLAANGTVVWEPSCIVDGPVAMPAIPVIAPGQTQTFEWQVSAAISGPGNPSWGSRTIDGTYRLRLALGAEAAFVSNKFAISVLTTSATIRARATLLPRIPREHAR